MAPRAYWKGYLKLSLVSFRQINKKTGNRLRQQLIDEETREPVEADDRGKGYEVSKGEYLLIEDDELEALTIESNHTIDIDSFVPAAQIDKRFYNSPYYIVPSDKVGQEAFAVIRDAMKGKDMVALGRIVVSKRERVIALEPYGKGLIGTTLHYAYEVRKADEYFDDIPDLKVSDEMLKLAEHILETKAGDFDPSQFNDRYEEAVLELIRKKQSNIPVENDKEEPAAPNVINLMDALRQSLRQAEAPPPPAKKPKKQIDGQKEMLLPIEGKKQAQRDAGKKPARTSGKQRKAG